MQFQISNTSCPRCHEPIKYATVEPHPTRADLVHHNYECTNCGPVMTKVISLREDAEKTGQAQRLPG
jgi:hypothetical protein